MAVGLSHQQTFYSPSTHFISRSLMFLAVLYLLFPLHPLTRSGFFNGKTKSSRRIGAKLLHFISLHSVNLICFQKFNLNPSSSFRIAGYTAMRSNRTPSWSGIFSFDDPHASGDIITLVRLGLSFSELSTFSLSSLNLHSDYVGFKQFLLILTKQFLLAIFPLTFMLPLIALFRRIAKPTSFPAVFFSFTNLFILGYFNCHHPLCDSKVTLAGVSTHFCRATKRLMS